MTVVPLVHDAAEPAVARCVPGSLTVLLDGLVLDLDIGFHAREIGISQRIRIDIEVTLDIAAMPARDCGTAAWDYDFIRREIHAMVAGRRYNLQETLARAIFDLIAAQPHVTGVKVVMRKLDIYPDAEAVGIALSS